MPKDTKKFINPLLRPSQTSEARPAVQTSPENEPVHEEIQAPNVPVVNNVEHEAAPASVVVEPIKSEDPPLDPQIKENTPKGTRLAPEFSNSNEAAIEESNSIRNSETSRESARTKTEPKSRASTERSAEVSAPRSGQVTARREPATLNRAGTERTDRASANRKFDDDLTELDPLDEDDRANAKRRRNIQSFESTHERITLWMDKRLKQRFEDLAFQRELPKTALINEAVTALLQKYEDR
ncbi:hypothetical protein KDA_65040 [Dictyobacter alpinus]|uniref:Uncharacterized protein n=1 Tax=Dictyobacter alpinus TaxID=2014873 RepID=A0A402BI70_9CHLR|nr:hypothetical protein [Dictyobacter alpinus]GCE31020.1 hypothetical protein KDA_65040 [Dictyobacter alpinus]